jgi:hypothetical protein
VQLLSRKGIRSGLLAKWPRRGLPALEQLHLRGLAPRAIASNARMARDAFSSVQPPVAPTDRVLRLPEEKVFLELTGRRCQPVLGMVSPQ